ncbi:MAG TPA: hypothetical protein VHN77_11900 [Phycisphaerales bacterium]|nr:hypothetical protein [Phycisphaerales bacterium]
MPGDALPWPGTRSTPLPPADGSPLAIDFKCTSCGYNLRGLSSISQCPECAFPIAHSIYGGSLTTAAPQFRSTIITGLTCIGYAALAFLAIHWIWLLNRTIGKAILGDVCTYTSLTAQVVMLAGVWLVASPDRGINFDAQPRSAQRTARIATVIIAALIAVQVLIMVLTSALGATAPLATADPLLARAKFVGWGVLFYAAMDAIDWVAARVPLPKVARRCVLFRWLVLAIPITFFAWSAALTGIAPPLTNAVPALQTTNPAFMPPANGTTILLWPVYAGAFILVTPFTVIWLWWTLSTLRAAVRKVHARTHQQPPANGDPAIAQPQPSPAST